MIGNLPRIANIRVNGFPFTGEQGPEFTDLVVDHVGVDKAPYIFERLKVSFIAKRFKTIEKPDQDFRILPKLLFLDERFTIRDPIPINAAAFPIHAVRQGVVKQPFHDRFIWFSVRAPK